ncbi:hypothetical protein [Devosia sp.]|uniref:hypothetical protein n=1 Tax=Devosia sp. TaxID=1871048 RepID=UPI001AD14746|nr:hypothetical protein [Devosia sp.]MBN9335375.1 hypothetical protein [Devosia sp.]
MGRMFSTAGTKYFIGGPIMVEGIDLNVSDFATQSWTEIGGTTNIGSIGDTAELISQNYINVARTMKMKGVRNAADVSLVCGFDPADEGQRAIRAAEKTDYNYAFKIEMNDKPLPKTATVTISTATPGVITWTGHDLDVDTPIVFTTTGALPTGLSVGVQYFVKTVATANTFTVSATPGGAAIDTTAAGSGTHTATATPKGSERYFAALVMGAVQQFDEANSVLQLNAQLAVNSNLVEVDAE